VGHDHKAIAFLTRAIRQPCQSETEHQRSSTGHAENHQKMVYYFLPALSVLEDT
jgi:hypothetical protein